MTAPALPPGWSYTLRARRHSDTWRRNQAAAAAPPPWRPATDAEREVWAAHQLGRLVLGTPRGREGSTP